MTWTVFSILAGCAAAMMAVELAGIRTTLVLQFKGDLKRESRFIAQYGQAVCLIFATILVAQLDGRKWTIAVPLVVATLGVSVVCTVIKRLTGRVRPNRENAGKFLGPTWKHANYRESFPSSHSASAFAMSTLLAAAYPPAAPTFFTLAGLCAGLRYVLDAHWASDVLGGTAVGFLFARLTWHWFGLGPV